MPLTHLVFTSRATREMSDADLHDIQATAGRDNAARGVSGVLFYGGGNFLEMLEGKYDAVCEVFDRIRKDKRHCAVHLLLLSPAKQRLHGEWTLGVANFDSERGVDYHELLQAIQRFRHPGDLASDDAKSLLDTFQSLATRVKPGRIAPSGSCVVA